MEAIKQQHPWSPFYMCIDFFIGVLPFAIQLDTRAEITLTELMKLVDEKLTQGGSEGELLSFLQALKAREQDIWQAWHIGEQKIAAGMEVKRE